MRSPLLTASFLALFPLLTCTLGASDAAASLAWRRFSAQSQAALADAGRVVTPLAPAADAAQSLQFTQFFGPVGDRGLEYSGTLRALEGQRVRISGYMVRETLRAPGVFMLTARPVVVEKAGYCFHEDLPPSTVHVVLPTLQPLPYRPGRLELAGILELGPRPEADGRNSVVRVVLDSAAATALAGATVADHAPAPASASAASPSSSTQLP